jgi:epoxyqueuosine reductase
MTMPLAQAIKNEARRLGFHLAGITSAEAPPHLATYTAWLSQGRHGEMAYLATDRARLRRSNHQEILPGCRSILALGIRYPAPNPGPPFPTIPGAGRVAAYAWGDDYHNVLPIRMRALASFIENITGAPVLNRWYTDTGPLLERDLAQRAGLGWIGKNTCLIHPKMGSYFLLAEILLGIDLDPDPPFSSDYCGACTRCIQACPTGCILPDRTLDARRCVSYLTIELKGPVPQDLRPYLGEWVFGCDICQQVCPWNQRFAPPHGDEAFEPRVNRPSPDLRQALRLSAREFNRQFKGSSIQRAKRRGYLRNIAIVLGNQGNPSAIPDLAYALSHDLEPLVRGHAAWALRRIGGRTAHQALADASKSEPDSWVLSEIREK